MIYSALFIAVYGLSMLLFLLVGEYLHHRKNRVSQDGDKIKLEDVTVIIPFRNEASNLPKLLSSLEKQGCQPKEYLFVDDHSEDEGSQLIQGTSLENIQVLKAEKEGKKQAIHQAFNKVETEYILTLDADVELPDGYFEALSLLPTAALTVLPVNMTTKVGSWMYCYDLYLSSAMNVAMAGWKRPIMANGANLLFHRDLMEKYYKLEDHTSIASGDDMFLLKAAKENNQDIQVISQPKLAIETEAPSSFRSFLQQRFRWLGKTKALGDVVANTYGIVQGIFVVGFIMLLVWSLVTEDFMSLLFLFLGKSAIDCIGFSAYFMRMKKGSWLLLLPLFELVFPVQLLVVGLASLFVKSEWKGRRISHS